MKEILQKSDMICNHFVAGAGPVVCHVQKKIFFLFAAVWDITAKSNVAYDSLAPFPRKELQLPQKLNLWSYITSRNNNTISI